MEETILTHVLDAGFSAAGIAAPDGVGDAGASFNAFLCNEFHGGMEWLLARSEERSHPRVLWPEVNSIIVVGLNYGPPDDPLALLGNPEAGTISAYARGQDYHAILKSRLKRIARWISIEYGADVKVFVDTAPVLEKPLAAAAGLGWQGKHTNLVSRSIGSWLFLGEIFTTLVLEPSESETDHCGTCQKCIDVCPTNAFPQPYQLDARRCISYLTIEHKGPIPVEFRKSIGNRIYGCDDCLAVCPWNKWAQITAEVDFLPREGLVAPCLEELVELDDSEFRRRFSKSPIKRTGRERFVRNVLIALGNSGGNSAGDAVERRLSDKSPLVRGAAVWALKELYGADKFRFWRMRLRPFEDDQQVLAEWDGTAL